MTTEYHNPETCNACGSTENAKIRAFDTFNCFPYAHEIETKCLKCGHADYWAHGFFASSSDGLDACAKYSFDKKVAE